MSTSQSVLRKVAAATTNSTLGRAGYGVIEGLILANASAAVKYVKLYDKATAPTVGTDVPILTIAVPATSSVVLGDVSITFQLGIGLGITGAASDTDTTVTAVNDVIAQVLYR